MGWKPVLSGEGYFKDTKWPLGTLDLRYLMLDFSNLPASPVTDGYAANGNTLELWWNGMLVESWTVTPTTPPAGTPLGLLLTLTYS